MFWFLLLNGGLFLAAVEAQDRRPTISYITQPEIVTDIGGTIEMKCSVQYSQDYPVVWMKLDQVDRNNDLPITSGTTMILTDPRFNVQLDKSTSTYSLRIEDIQETDSAVYQCQVIIALTDKEVADVPLIVRRPPIISDNSTRSVVVVEGERVELKCYASGYPPPVIYWRRQNNAVLPTNTSIYQGNVLTFEYVKKEHRGTYFCVASNVVGQGARRNVDVEVEFSPILSVPRKRVGQALQFDMDLECHIEAYPPPAIKWFRDNILLTNNQHYHISHFAFDDEYTNTILRVITIEKKQYANYSCKAINILGEADGHVVLFETVVPICPPACDGYNYSSDAPEGFFTLGNQCFTVALIMLASIIFIYL
jgi:neuronal growth regulator 1